MFERLGIYPVTRRAFPAAWVTPAGCAHPVAAAMADSDTQILVKFVTKLPAELRVPQTEVVRMAVHARCGGRIKRPSQQCAALRRPCRCP